MSKENVKLFYEALAKDKALQERARGIAKKYAGQKLDEKGAELVYQKELVPLGRETGFNFTLAELNEYASESKRPAMREVSEEELAGVAGGAICVCVAAGGGNIYAGTPWSQEVCTCIAYGDGNWSGGKVNCICFLGGGGG